MASKLFLDANCLLDLTLHRDGFHQVDEIIRLSIEGELRLYTTPAVIHVVAYFTAQSFTNQQTRKIILTLLNDVGVIDSDHSTTLIALNSSMTDIEDALQYYTSLKFELGYFISSNKKLKKSAIPQLPVYTPTEFLEEINQR